MRACGGIRQTFTTASVLQELRNIPPKTQESAKTFFRDQWHYYQLVYVSLFSFHYYKLAVNIMQTFPAARYHFELAVIIIVVNLYVNFNSRHVMAMFLFAVSRWLVSSALPVQCSLQPHFFGSAFACSFAGRPRINPQTFN